MKYNPDIHHRRSIRLREYNYATSGAYFVTVCTQGRECLFGDVVADEMQMNDAGRMVESVWNDLPVRYLGVTSDVFVVMPNHFHGIVVLQPPATKSDFPVGAAPRGRPGFQAPRGRPDVSTEGHPQGGAPTFSLFDVVHRFKSLTTARYRHGVKHADWPPFPGRLWQRNYYERVIRNDEELISIREYIQCNPANWARDEEHPDRANP